MLIAVEEKARAAVNKWEGTKTFGTPKGHVLDCRNERGKV
jgi:hypothetical protein